MKYLIYEDHHQNRHLDVFQVEINQNVRFEHIKSVVPGAVPVSAGSFKITDKELDGIIVTYQGSLTLDIASDKEQAKKDLLFIKQQLTYF